MKRLMLAAAALTALSLPAFAAGDAAEGEKVFKKCMACHAVGPEAKNKVGPELNAIIGRTAGTHADFKYSEAMIEAGKGGLVWTAETLETYLTKPKDLVKGTKMTFAGLPKPEDRANVIAYLETFK